MVEQRISTYWWKAPQTNKWYTYYATAVFEAIEIREKVNHISVSVQPRWWMEDGASVAYSNTSVTRYRCWGHSKDYHRRQKIWSGDLADLLA